MWTISLLNNRIFPAGLGPYEVPDSLVRESLPPLRVPASWGRANRLAEWPPTRAPGELSKMAQMR